MIAGLIIGGVSAEAVRNRKKRSLSVFHMVLIESGTVNGGRRKLLITTANFN